MKKKRILLLLLSIIVMTVIMNYESIIAFAKNISIEVVKKGEILNSGDILDLTLEDEYGGKYPQNVLFVYVDKDGKLLTSYRNNTQPSKLISDYEVGSLCHEALGYSKEECSAEYVKDQYTTNNSYYDVLYVKNQNELKNISKWIVQEVGESTVAEICEEYSSDVSNTYICNNLQQQVDHGSGYYTYKNNYPDKVIVLREYEDASFELICEDDKLKYGESTVCKFKGVATEENVTSIELKFNTDYLTIENIEGLNNWEYKKSDDVDVFENNTGSKENFDIASITVKANQNVSAKDEIVTGKITYKTSSGEYEHMSVSDNIEIEGTLQEIIKNPETSSFNILVYGILGSISLIIFVKIIQKRKKIDI